MYTFVDMEMDVCKYIFVCMYVYVYTYAMSADV